MLPIGVDDEIGDEIGTGRLDQDMDALGGPGAALGVADNPAHRVAGGDGARADELLARFERDVGDLAGRSVDLIERAVRVGIDLDGVDIAGAGRLHARGTVGLVDARMRIAGLRWCGPGAGDRFQLARQRQELRQLDDLHGLRRIGLPARPAGACRRS